LRSAPFHHFTSSVFSVSVFQHFSIYLPMRIYTCTPVAFGGGPDFFARDSGLLCRGLQAIGVDSRAVMPGERKPEDEADLIRTEYANLESAAWWRAQQLDGVVLYSWGSPKFRKVAAAIHEAGIFLILNQDNGGLVSPLAGPRGWWRDQCNLTGGGPALWRQVAKGFSYGLLASDPLRAAHLRCGDVIACVSPKAAEHYRKLCWYYGGRSLVARIRVLPHAVESRFHHSHRTKRHQVACVGRWNDRVQKQPELLMEVIGALVAEDDAVTVIIVGNPADDLARWHAQLPEEMRARIDLRGNVGRDELAAIFDASRVFYSPSAFESFGIAAAEALCCGCSVVAARSVSMSAFEWFVSENSGTLADTNQAAGHLKALLSELDQWQLGGRNAERISSLWCGRLHADKVAQQIMDIARGA
jgi:glycosyltransferase involved in cell wall biosynthesis